MPYDVAWSPEAESDLARIWLAEKDRDSVTRASHRIDVALQSGPLPGHLQSEGLYRICDAPLVAYYEIAQHMRKIKVTNVLAYRPPSS